MGSDFESGDGTNPRVESESFLDGSSLENRVDSASLHVITPSDNSTNVRDVDTVGVSVVEGSIDSNVSVLNHRGAGDSTDLGDIVSHDKEVFSDRSHGSVKNVKSEHQKGQRKKEKKLKESGSPVYDSMMCTFDDFAANRGGAMVVRSSMEASPDHKFEVGDMVWGKVKSHPWWPGHVYSEYFATPSVRRLKRDDLLLVAFFGDSSYGWFDRSELIPFDSNFAEKSRQTNSKTFVKAVEEAVDEVSRRSALGLACMCRNKQNFRETSVHGYYAVDVPDYEPGAVYSIDAIGKAREGFRPNSALDFIRQLALEPTSSENAGIDFLKNKANVISYRRAIYEEFDETYAQAFGYQPVHSAPGSVHESTPVRTTAKAPLSGRQVFADTSGIGKTSAKPNKPKDHSKKDKYLFKRRDEPKDNPKMAFSPHIDHVHDSISGDYVLQKRGPAKDEINLKIATETKFGLEDTPTDSELTESPTVRTSGDDEKKIVPQTEDRKVFSHNHIPNSVPLNGPKKIKVAKRPAEEMGSGKSLLPEKKKKKNSDGTLILRKEGVPIVEKVSAKKPFQTGFPSKPKIEDPHRTDMNRSGNHELEIPKILSDLHSLALDPFLLIDKGLAGKVRLVFLRFRSVVFQKSLTSEDDGNDSNSSKSLISGTSDTGIAGKPPASSAGKPDDPTKTGRKRGPSDRQEEMAEKKKKKVGDIRNLTKEKKVIKKIDDPAARDVKPPPARKPELKKNPEQRSPEPTMLIMKFPTGGSLPSINELKARFARYGPMDHAATRIYWNTFTCRVVYRNKSHALAAYKFVTGSSSLFGNINIKCSLKEFGVLGSSDSEPLVKALKEDPSATEDRPAMLPATPGLKSIMKKSGGEEAGGGGGSRGMPRVKFMLGGDEAENKNGSGFSSSNATIDFNSKNGSSSTTQFTRPPPPPANSMHYGMAAASPLPPRPLNYAATDTTPPGNFVHNLQRPSIGSPATPKVDISKPMLSLLTKCNEVVINVTNFYGYVPYHPL